MEKLKRVLLIAMFATLAATLAACGGGQGSGSGTAASNGASTSPSSAAEASEESEAGPRLDIVGAFYGDLGSDETYQDLCIVFDYINDDANRTLPVSGEDVTVKINDTNVYTAPDNDTHNITSTSTGEYEIKTFDYAERYTGYRYPVGYGDILGGSDPIRMFVSVLFNPNDFKSGETITLSIGDLSGQFPVSEATQIKIADEMLKAEPDYKTAQILAAEKWRLDCAAEVAKSLAHSLRFGGGDEFSGYSQAMKTLFSAKSGGVSVFEEPHGGFNSDTHTFNTVVDDLPAYDHDVITKGYPEAADLIDSIESQWDALSDSILDPGTSKETYAEQIGGILDTYHEICDTLGIGTIKNL